MKIITLHSDYIRFQPVKKAIKEPEDVSNEQTEVRECLVVLTSVEKSDELAPEHIIERLVNEIKDISSKVKVENIVLYPYAHLSSELASPEKALLILKSAEEKLKVDFNVTRAPFGWYKELELKCKGHPLAELSRNITIDTKTPEKEDNVSQAITSEKKLKSYWYIMESDGRLIDIEHFDFNSHKKLKTFAFYEKAKERRVTEEPLHVKAMKKLELVDYEPGSDSGNLRYYPKGRLIKSLLENYVTQRTVEYGAVEVETPIMYDMHHPTLSRYLNRFPARQYQIESDKRSFFLRFAACFGQFLIAHDATISYRDMPFRLYEMTRYSFRREQKGELTGLRRLRAFTMPDVHALCTDITQAMAEFKTRFNLCLNVQEKIGLTKDDFELAIRFTREFYNAHKEFIEFLVSSFGKPVLVEMWDERPFYFILKYELNFVDSLNKASALSTDQIDVENGERYDIKFTSQDGTRKHPIILHCSPSGAIERVIYAVLEKAMASSNPTLPLWLCPTQVRIIPVSENHISLSESTAVEFEKCNIRIDIDDRTMHVGKKIRDAELEWVPYIIVIGEREEKSSMLNVRIRELKSQKEMSKEELINYIKHKTRDMPFRPLSLPKLLSKRPTFVG